MLAIIEEYERRTEANRKVLLGMKLPDDGLTAQAVLNNNHLLVANLKGLFSEEKGEYLPNAIRKNLNGQISRIHQSYAQLEQGPAADHGPRILEQMDGLYAYCLQYGLITFGFPGKEQSQIVQTLRNEVNAIESELDRFSADIREAKDKIDEECSKASENLTSAVKQACEEVNKNRDECIERVNLVNATLDNQMTEFQTGAEERTKTADNLVVAIKNQLNAAQESSQACAQSANAIKAISEEANGALSAISATAAQASEQLTLATSHTKGAAAQLQNATQHAADAKAKSDTVAGHLANAKQYEEEIDAFYAEIETHKTTMLEVKKKADSDLAKLKSGHHLLCTIGRDDTPGVSDVFCGGPVQEGTPGRRGVCI